MAGSVKRALAIVAGVMLGMAIAAGASPWRQLFKKTEPVQTAPIQRERAPDTRAQSPTETEHFRHPGVPA